MHKDEFDRDMQEYLRARKKAGFDIRGLINKLLPKKQPSPHVDLPEEVEVYHEESQKPARKETVLTKFFKKEEPANEALLREQMRADDALNDMKEVSKIALSAVKQLQDEQLREFKQSPDFERLKTILKKHDLIK